MMLVAGPGAEAAAQEAEAQEARQAEPRVEIVEVAEMNDLSTREPPIDDLAPRRLAPLAAETPATGAEVSLSFRTQLTEERREYAGGLLLTLPLAMLWSAPSKAKRVERDADVDTEKAAEPAMAAPPGPPAVVTGADVRRLLAAAHLDDLGRETALADLETRARWSALLPRVRLRATRLLDEETRLSPTSYDADRTTASGGASLWLEARATWSLDRLVFASEEVRIEQLRRRAEAELESQRAELVDLLFRWQAARLRLADVWLDGSACLEAWLAAERAAAELSFRTHGWFTRHLATRGDVRCQLPWQAVEE